MRSSSHLLLLAALAVTLLAPACSDDPNRLTGDGASPSGPGDPSGDPGGEPPDPPDSPDGGAPVPDKPPAASSSFSDRTLERARAWIDAGMPYCGGPNGGHDAICGGTCSRDGKAANAQWDKYRSDCSGFVSWAWGLAPPGLTTATLAPFDTSDSAVIPLERLVPGDALNGKGHVMLWGGWVDEKAGKALILQESRCGTDAHEKVITLTKVDATSVRTADGRRFYAIRVKDPAIRAEGGPRT